jgi:hypothetical protein
MGGGTFARKPAFADWHLEYRVAESSLYSFLLVFLVWLEMKACLGWISRDERYKERGDGRQLFG